MVGNLGCWVDGQAGPCMGRCMGRCLGGGGAWVNGDGDGDVLGSL